MVYDTETGQLSDLGAGWLGDFSPSGRYYAWFSSVSSEVQLFDLTTSDERPLTAVDGAVKVAWLGADTVFIGGASGGPKYFSAATGDEIDAPAQDPTAAEADERGDGRFALSFEDCDQQSCPSRSYALIDETGALAPLEFDAYLAVLGSEGSLIVATPPVDDGPTVNVFEVDPVTAEATFLATATRSVGFTALNWPLDADPTHVLWVENHCVYESNFSRPATRAMLYDRATGEVTELLLPPSTATYFVEDGLLGNGAFGPTQLLDVEALEYVAVLPDNVGDVRWSNDLRFAATGQVEGHGGLCP